MRKTICALFIMVSLSSCFLRKASTISNTQARRNNREIQKEATQNGVNYTNYTPSQYIERYKAVAIQEMNTYGIPASITLAQGLFESANGNSDLARMANNHFGIKCGNSWTGKSYYKNDDAENECFRVYSSPEESYRDHSKFLKRKNYTALFDLDKTDYKGWAKGLKKAGYATNPNYPTLLINIIERYNLSQYDSTGNTLALKTNRTAPAFNQSNNSAQSGVADPVTQPSQNSKTYTVKQGDTLYNISKRFGLSVDDLKALNGLPDNGIKIGQQLVVAK